MTKEAPMVNPLKKISEKQRLILGLGILFGVGLLKSWVAVVACAVVVMAIGMALRSPFPIWIFLLVNTFLFTNYIGPPVCTFIFWGFLFLFILSVGWHQWVAGKSPLLGDRFLMASILGWLCWGIISIIFSSDVISSTKEMVRYFVWVATLFVFMQWLSNEKTLRHVLRYLWMALLTYAVLLIVKSVVANNIAGGLLGNHWHSQAEAGGIFAAFLPIYANLLKHMRGNSWINVFGLGLFVIAILISSSASALLAVGIGMIVLLLMQSPFQFGRIIIWGFMAMMGVLTISLLSIDGLWEKMIYQLSGRDRIWAAALEAIVAHPLFGVGPGQWTSWFSAEYTSADFIMDDLRGNTFYLNPATLGGQAHNLFLTKAVEMGIPSFVFLICVFGAWLLKAQAVLSVHTQGWKGALLRGCLASFVGLMFFSLFENGPVIGVAREIEILFVPLIMAIPLVAEHWLLKSPREYPC